MMTFLGLLKTGLFLHGFALLSILALSFFDRLANVSALSGDNVNKVDPQTSFIVWGPGLKEDVVLPVRYFMIQVVDIDGQNVSESIGESPFQVTVSNFLEKRMRVWVRISDRRDGSYVVQYKLYNTCDGLKIQILFNSQHVAESPYMLKGSAFHEKCYCPDPDLESWMSRLDCPASGYSQIKEDLSFFPSLDMQIIETEILQRFNTRHAHSLCHYVIKDNQVYRKTFGEHVGFKMFMDAILLSITRKVHLPDLEFFVNLGDWPLVKRKTSDRPLPIFSWCGSDETFDIVMPTYDVTESTLETMGRVSLDLVSVQGAKVPGWNNKSSHAFWRGRDSRQERLDLVRLSIKHPDLIDAKLTNMFFFKQETDLEITKHISFFDFFQYKYQLNMDGTVAAYRFPYLLGGDSLVLKQESMYYEHFYKSLKEYEHYVPFKRDLSDLLEQIDWAKNHDEQVQEMIHNAQTFVRENLMADHIFCYHVKLFQEYSRRLVTKPVVREDMELVPQPSDHEATCDCPRLQKTKVEL